MPDPRDRPPTSVGECVRPPTAPRKSPLSCYGTASDRWWICSSFGHCYRARGGSDSPHGHAGPEHLRRALEELGPTFIKLGQVLSTRPDLVPPEYEAALAELQDSAPTVPAADIVAAVESALGRPLRETFRDFGTVPIAAASIGQVHPATLPDGADVVVKVRRPGVVAQVAVDLELLDRLAAVAGGRSSIARHYDPVGLAREFGATLLAELDYPREGRNAERIAAEFADDERVRIPKVLWELTGEGVITEERVRGIKVDDVRGLEATRLDRTKIARDLRGRLPLDGLRPRLLPCRSPSRERVRRGGRPPRVRRLRHGGFDDDAARGVRSAPRCSRSLPRTK